MYKRVHTNNKAVMHNAVVPTVGRAPSLRNVDCRKLPTYIHASIYSGDQRAGSMFSRGLRRERVR